MIRATTPTVTIATNTDLSEYATVNMYFRQDISDSDLVKKVKTDLTISENTATATLTQAETKLFDAHYPLKIQLRVYDDGVALATKIFTVSVHDVLNDEVLS